MSHCTDIVTTSTWMASRVWSIGGIADRLHFIDVTSAMISPSSASLQRSSSLQNGLPVRGIVIEDGWITAQIRREAIFNKHFRALCFSNLFASLTFSFEHGRGKWQETKMQ